MAILSTLGLQKAYGTRVLFSDVTLEVGDKDHIGLIGANGAGKTTLFQILTGAAEPDAGTVRRAKLLDIQSLAQTPHMEEGQTAYEFALEAFSSLAALERALEETNAALLKGGTDALIKRQHELSEKYERDGGLTYKSRARAALLGLGFTEAELSLRAQDLSGGQRNKAMLARALISGAGLLLLDEPTNHLDIRASEWLEAALKSWNGAFIVISHDRYFLDQVTSRTFELSGGRLHVTNGNYSRHAQLRAGGQEAARRKYYNTQKEIRRITGIVEQQRRWNRERNIRAAESKLKQIERLKKTLVEPERAPDSVRFSFHAEIPGGSDALVAEGLAKAYGDKKLFFNVSLHIRAGERVFLLGPNGCGKTTLMRILMGREQADEGYAYFGTGVEPAYYEQDMRSMRLDASVLTEVHDAFPRMDIQGIRNALAAFLFRGQDVDKRVDMLSGGEKARVQLLKLMLSGSNLLLLDEPTNHLDIASREALERALEEYGGAMLIVTHDRYLVNRIADRVLFMANGGVTETIGGYDAYVGLEEEADAEPVMKEKNAYRLKKEQQAAFTRAKGVLKRAEEAVAGAEAEIAALEARLSQPEIAGDYQQAGKLAGELDACRAALDARYLEWELADKALDELNEDSEEQA